MKVMTKNVLHAAAVALGLLAVPVTAMTVRFAIYAPYLASVFGE